MSASSVEASRRREESLLSLGREFQGVLMFDDESSLLLSSQGLADAFRIDENSLQAGVSLENLLAAVPQHLGDSIRAAIRAPGERCSLKIAEGEHAFAIEQFSDGSFCLLCEISQQQTTNAKCGEVLKQTTATRAEFSYEVEKYVGQDEAEHALLYLDLDRFKRINDTFGHDAGDQLLRQFVDRVRALLQPRDILGRLGGDEFAVLQVGRCQPSSSRQLANSIIQSAREPFWIDGCRHEIGVSIGIAVAPFDGQESAELLRNADLAMYRSKSEGRGTLRYFEAQMATEVERRRMLESQLRAAIESEEFELLYQPIKDLASDRVVTFEALVRWRRDAGTLVSPEEFIPLAEETGLIVPLGEWILRRACRDMAQYQGSASVAVNVSPVQLKHRSFVSIVADAIKESGLPAQRLELEITENALIENGGLALAILNELRDMGVRIALDDFGTGYSSINYLRKLPLDKIKIDRSFVRNSDTDADASSLIKMIAALGVSLQVSTTAEGVESEAELETVRQLGCTQIQGFHLSKPMTLAQLNELSAKGPTNNNPTS